MELYCHRGWMLTFCTRISQISRIFRLDGCESFSWLMLLYGDLTYKIRGAIFEVYNYWGPGLFEQVYEESLVHQLRKVGLKVEQQVPLPVIYDGVKLPCDYRLDLLVEDKVIIELKSVEELHPVHYKQLMTYLKIAHKKVGLLVNFNVDDMAKGIHRLVL